MLFSRLLFTKRHHGNIEASSFIWIYQSDFQASKMISTALHYEIHTPNAIEERERERAGNGQISGGLLSLFIRLDKKQNFPTIQLSSLLNIEQTKGQSSE